MRDFRANNDGKEKAAFSYSVVERRCGDVAGSPVRQTDGKNHLGASTHGAQILFAELLANH